MSIIFFKYGIKKQICDHRQLDTFRKQTAEMEMETICAFQRFLCYLFNEYIISLMFYHRTSSQKEKKYI